MCIAELETENNQLKMRVAELEMGDKTVKERK